MKYCPYCGAGLQDSMVFCPVCGRKFLAAAKGIDDDDPHYTSPQIEAEVHAPVVENTPSLSSPSKNAPPIFIKPMPPQKVVEDKESRTSKRRRPFKGLLVGLIIVLLLLVVGSVGKRFLSNKQIERLSNSVFYLELYNSDNQLVGSGSGFLVQDGVTLVTNYHVIEDVYHIMAYSADGKQQSRADSVLAYNKTLDLAILKLEHDFGFSPIPLGDSDSIKKGDKVYAIGYPLGVTNTLSEGVVSSLYESGGTNVIQTTAAISSGSSGGVLLSKHGMAIGVTAATYVDGQNMNLTIPINYVKQLLTTDSRPIPLSTLFPSNKPSSSTKPATPGVPYKILRGTWIVDIDGYSITLAIDGKEATIECSYDGEDALYSPKSNHGTIQSSPFGSIIVWDTPSPHQKDTSLIIYYDDTQLELDTFYSGTYYRQ